jgi:Putative lumazine-binding
MTSSQDPEFEMTSRAAFQSLLEAVERYFDLMFDCDISRFEQVFAPSAQLHGLREGNLRLLPAQDYRNLLASGPSPKSKNAPREEEILLVDFASPTQALVRVRVRINTILYLDYPSFHRIDGVWLITAKSFHAERTYEPAAC